MISKVSASPSFKANYIKQVAVKKLNETTNKYQDEKVSLVELISQDICDVFNVSMAVKNWEYDSYGGNIAFHLHLSHQSNMPQSEFKFYAITKQKNDFEVVEPEDILGLAEINQPSKNELVLNYIQTNPDYLYNTAKPEYTGIGSAMLNFFKLFDGINKISLTASKSLSVFNFYIKNGFTKISDNNFVYIKK